MKIGATGPAFTANEALVLLNKSLGKGQAKPAATLPSRNQREKDSLSDVFRDTGAVIDNMQIYS